MKKDTMICLALMLVAVTAFMFSFYFPETTIWSGGNTDRPYTASAGTWPRVVCVVMFLLCLLLILYENVFSAYLGSPKNSGEALAQEGEGLMSLRDPHTRRHAVLFGALFLAYMLLLMPLGFALATLMFGLGVVAVLPTGRLSLAKCMGIATIISVIIVVLFCRVLYLPLPRGMGFFRELSQMIIF